MSDYLASSFKPATAGAGEKYEAVEVETFVACKVGIALRISINHRGFLNPGLTYSHPRRAKLIFRVLGPKTYSCVELACTLSVSALPRY